jgi:lysophospholipase L1-like esterase
LTLLISPVTAEEFFFRDGDRVVMIGDSITEQLLYSNYVEMWVSTRFPAWNITFRNVGIGGDRSTGGNARFNRDVNANKPTAMTVDFGMNDGGYKPFDEAGFKTYMGGLQGMADQAKAAGIRVAWATPQPLDKADPGPTALTDYNQTLEQYSQGVKAIAEKNGGLFADQFHPYLAVLDKARSAEPKYDRITGGDAVHPGPPGQALMAFSILQGLHFPKQVSSVEIRLADAAKVSAANCRVTEVARDGDGVRFVREDQALPFFPEEAQPILKWAPLLEAANDYGLKITGLKPGKYEVSLGDKKVAEYTAEQLAQGVNLAGPALAAGPVADQVKAVKGAIEAKNKFYHDKIFRGIVLANFTLPDWLGINMTPAEIDSKRQAALAERTAKMPELDAAIKQALKSKPHTVAIKPAG